MTIAKYIYISVIVLATSTLFGQGTIKGYIMEKDRNKPITYASIKIVELNKGGFSNDTGYYEITDVPLGNYSIEVSSFGFNTILQADIEVSGVRQTVLNFDMVSNSDSLGTVVVTVSPFDQDDVSPISVRKLGATEIARLPGANRDVSKVVTALPGVAQNVAFRNDIIIRGGSPTENMFFLDGIEVPTINHFTTQGASGGPVGLLNVNFIEEAKVSTSAFDMSRAAKLSSVLSFSQKEGNTDKLLGNVALGSSDLGITLDGPLGQNTNFIFSARVSYLQFLFQALKLPFLPTYFDSQLKVTHTFKNKDKLFIIGLGAYDDFNLNEKVNEGVDDPDQLESNEYILANLPEQDQYNYTLGVRYQHYLKNGNGYQNFIISGNRLVNVFRKYADNDNSDPSNQVLDIQSQEVEGKFRFEHIVNKKGYRIMFGGGYQIGYYENDFYQQFNFDDSIVDVNTYTDIFVNKFSLFSQVSKRYAKDKLLLTLGLRTDFSDYNQEMLNPLEQLAPSFALSYQFAPDWFFNASTAWYHQLPSYTILGYRDEAGTLVNQENGIGYIDVAHAVAGFEYRTKWNARFTVEGFFKYYTDYPWSVTDSISLANLGGDFGIVGNEAVESISNGQAYGVEFLYEQKLTKGFFGIVAYTYVQSKFDNGDGNYIPSAWDSRNIVSLTVGKIFKKGWQIGAKWQFSGGAPYTPYDYDQSAFIPNWEAYNAGILNYSELNSQRLAAFHQLDIRVDKKWNFKKWNLNLYVDIQNAYNFQAQQAPYLDTVKDADGNPVVNPNNPSEYVLKEVTNTAGTIIPTIGVIIDFAFK